MVCEDVERFPYSPFHDAGSKAAETPAKAKAAAKGAAKPAAKPATKPAAKAVAKPGRSIHRRARAGRGLRQMDLLGTCAYTVVPRLYRG